MEAFEAVRSFEAQLPSELGSVVAARRLVCKAVDAWGLPDHLADDAALAVSELVTNAVLHAGTVVGVVVRRLGPGVRIEVRDGSPRLPVVGANRPEDLLATRSMTGRGLAVLAAMVDRWGTDPVSGGKIMWAEVGTGRRWVVEMDAQPQMAPARELRKMSAVSMAAMTIATAMSAEGRRVQLIGVPVRLLVESAKQSADVAREMQVVGMDHTGPDKLLALAERSREVSARIDVLREAGSTVVEAALARGDDVVDLDFVVPSDAVDVFDQFGSLIRGMGETKVKRELLTLPPSDEVTAYRRWFHDEIAAQLTGRAPEPCPFAVSAAS